MHAKRENETEGEETNRDGDGQTKGSSWTLASIDPAVVLRTCGSCGLVYKGMSIYVLTFARCLNNASHVLSFSLMNW
jgi:hypothetical protein